MRQKLDTNHCMRETSLTVHTYPDRDMLIGQLMIHFKAAMTLRSESRKCLPRPHVDPNLAWEADSAATDRQHAKGQSQNSVYSTIVLDQSESLNIDTTAVHRKDTTSMLAGSFRKTYPWLRGLSMNAVGLPRLPSTRVDISLWRKGFVFDRRCIGARYVAKMAKMSSDTGTIAYANYALGSLNILAVYRCLY